MESRLLLRMARASRDLAAAAAALARQVAAKDATRASRAAAAPTASLPADVAAKDVPRASSASAALAAPLPARVAGADGNLAARVGSDNTDHLESCFQPFSYSCVDYMSDDEYDSIPDDAKLPTDKDLQSDEATWALYERWCKAFQKERDLVEMTRRFEIFKHYANQVHIWNNGLPADPKKAAAFSRKREKVKKLLSKGQDVSQFDEIYVPMVLGVFADGGDPDIIEWNKHLLKSTEERHDVKDECA